ncbi:MAG: PKD-like family lipoprotein, partial [Flavobacteriaceae bacterium]
MKKILYILITTASIFSCVTDDTVHEFKTLGAVTVEGLEDNYIFNYLEEANVEPQVSFQNGLSEQDVEYRWYMYNPQSARIADTLSREKNMNSVISSEPRDDYTLVFSIKDLNTGIVHRNIMSAEVLGALSRGMMVLS